MTNNNYLGHLGIKGQPPPLAERHDEAARVTRNLGDPYPGPRYQQEQA